MNGRTLSIAMLLMTVGISATAGQEKPRGACDIRYFPTCLSTEMIRECFNQTKKDDCKQIAHTIRLRRDPYGENLVVFEQWFEGDTCD